VENSNPPGRFIMKRKRFVLEGTWGSHGHVYHRQVVYNPELYKDLKSITFDDGTTLRLSIREATPYEKVELIHGYDSLIDRCIRHNVCSVAEIKELSL
jgi:hypothetical protein